MGPGWGPAGRPWGAPAGPQPGKPDAGGGEQPESSRPVGEQSGPRAVPAARALTLPAVIFGRLKNPVLF